MKRKIRQTDPDAIMELIVNSEISRRADLIVTIKLVFTDSNGFINTD